MKDRMIFTIGHSTRTIDEFLALLKQAKVDCLIDVRRFPRSRRQPQFNDDALAASLRQAGIGYVHSEALGGRRGKRSDGKPSPNTLWREESFRNYADYAETPEFTRALGEVRAISASHRPAVMCAEALWWQCHRRLITDYLLAAGESVEHIMAPGKIQPAKLTEGAQILAGGRVLYAAPDLFTVAAAKKSES
jgi:uncharacterized protein (DUF488 family)